MTKTMIFQNFLRIVPAVLCNQRGILENVWRPVYQDFLTLLKPLTGE
jgi:hypothetical protein